MVRVDYGVVMQHFGVYYRSFGDKSREIPEVRVGDVDHGGDGKGVRRVNSLLAFGFLFLLHYSYIIRKTPIFQHRFAKPAYFSK